MKVIYFVSLPFFFTLFWLGAGCNSLPTTPKSPPKTDAGLDASIYTLYAPAKLDIMPLTELISPAADTKTAQINLYVGLLDLFGSPIKSPGVFRFELYEYVQRSTDPKGERLIIWPDLDLTDPVKNNGHWLDFLRAYQFSLDFETQAAQTYVLQVTFICPADRRLSSEILLKLVK
jgi:hypothetical protein